jgi:hypothetical protein
MKPTPQTSPKQREPSFPLTDYNFRPTAETEARSVAAKPSMNLRGFHKLSSRFGAEISRDYITELSVFALITANAAWAIISAAIAVTRLVRNY